MMAVSDNKKKVRQTLEEKHVRGKAMLRRWLLSEHVRREAAAHGLGRTIQAEGTAIVMTLWRLGVARFGVGG